MAQKEKRVQLNAFKPPTSEQHRPESKALKNRCVPKRGCGRQQTHNSIFTECEIETEVHAKRKIMMFMFSTLPSSLLYNTADASTSFPAFYTCSVFSMLMLAILLLDTISDQSLLRRICGYFTCRKTVIPKFSQTGKRRSAFEGLLSTIRPPGMHVTHTMYGNCN